MLRVPQVVERTGLARSTLYKMVKAGDFPPPRELTSRVVGWPEEEVEDWIASRPVADPDRAGLAGASRREEDSVPDAGAEA